MEVEPSGEEQDQLDDMIPWPADSSVTEAVLRLKQGDPSKFASFWEMDEEDIQEDTEEEIQRDPSKKVLWAAEHDQCGVLCEMLRERPELIHARDSDGYTPLHRAAYNGHTNIIEVLISQGADIHAVTIDGWTALHSACRWDQTEAAAILIQRGATINAQTNGGQTPLHLVAANAECVDTLKLLLMNKQTDTTVKNSMGETARSICERSNPFGYLFEITDDHINRLHPE